MTADDLLATARLALGTPFRHQGRIVGRGLDCAGLLIHVLREAGIEHRDREGYARLPSNGQLEAALDEHVEMGILIRVPVSEMRAGDFVLMKFEGENAARHLGIHAGKTLIHSWAIARKVCEHDFDATWQRRVVRAYRLTELNDE